MKTTASATSLFFPGRSKWDLRVQLRELRHYKWVDVIRRSPRNAALKRGFSHCATVMKKLNGSFNWSSCGVRFNVCSPPERGAVASRRGSEPESRLKRNKEAKKLQNHEESGKSQLYLETIPGLFLFLFFKQSLTWIRITLDSNHEISHRITNLNKWSKW